MTSSLAGMVKAAVDTAVCNVLTTSANRAPSACAKKGQQNMTLKALYSVFFGHKRRLTSNQDCQGPKRSLDSNLDGQNSLPLTLQERCKPL